MCDRYVKYEEAEVDGSSIMQDFGIMIKNNW